MSPVPNDTSFIENRPPSVAVQFRERVQKSPEREAYRYPAADGEPWTSVTWKETGERVEKLAAGLLALGLQPEQRVGIAAGTRVEWIFADLAIMCAGGATTTVYPSTMAEDVAYIVADSECRIVFAEDASQLDKLKQHRSELPHLDRVVLFEGAGDGDWVLSLADLSSLGEKHLAETADAVERAVDAIAPEHLATLIYTSGTTGKPKGVRLTHASWTYEGAAMEAQGILSEEDLQFLWLPMAHSFGKVLLSTQLACGFATAVDGRVEKIIENLAIVKPTFMGAAPRIFEKAHGRILTMQAAEGGAKEKMFNQAFAVGRKVDALKREGKSVPLPLKLQHAVFDRLVFSKIRDRFGGRVRFFISGAAALNRDIAEWFHAAGILILEGYGLTETSAGSFVNHPDNYKFGTVGPVVPGSQVRLGEGDEIQIKGPGIMDGYHNLPDQTAETLTEDGWLRTGDKGSSRLRGLPDHHRPDQGALQDLRRQVHRSAGHRGQVQGRVPLRQPVHGVRRRAQLLRRSRHPRPRRDRRLGRENGLGGKAYAEIVAAPQTREMVDGYVAELNDQLNRWETIKKFELLDHDLSVESGELTPSMKVKRNVVENNHGDLIEGMYA